MKRTTIIALSAIGFLSVAGIGVAIAQNVPEAGEMFRDGPHGFMHARHHGKGGHHRGGHGGWGGPRDLNLTAAEVRTLAEARIIMMNVDNIEIGEIVDNGDGTFTVNVVTSSGDTVRAVIVDGDTGRPARGDGDGRRGSRGSDQSTDDI